MKIGTCGWTYLPKKLTKAGESRLAAYSKIFSVVEVNNTFHQMPKSSTARTWRKEVDQANKDFEFTVKVSKMITHISNFTDIDTWEKIKEIAKELRAELLVFQTPKTFKDTKENIQRVVDFFSAEDNFKFAMEARGWSRETIEKVFPELNIIQITDPFKEEPIEQEINYYRLHGLGQILYRYRFKDEDLEKLANIVNKNDYILFNNIFMYDDALRFLELLKTKGLL